MRNLLLLAIVALTLTGCTCNDLGYCPVIFPRPV